MSKNGKKVFLLGALIMALVLAGCASDDASDDSAEQFSATAENFNEIFNSIREKPGNYVINLTGDLLDYPGIGMETAGVNITVKGTGANKITGSSPIFGVIAGKITLENINLSRSPGNTEPPFPILWGNGGTIEIKSGVVLSNNDGSQYFHGVSLDDGAFIMSGGTIEKCAIGVIIGKGTITMSGGNIRNNTQQGIYHGGTENCTVSVSGGTISGNTYNGISLEDNTKDCTVNVSGGTISDNQETCVFVRGAGHKITISGNTTISDNQNGGVLVRGTGHKVTISGNTSISKSKSFGLIIQGSNIEFAKEKNAIIYGNDAGDNKNNAGSILVDCGSDSSNLYLPGDAGRSDVFKAKTNSDGTGIASKEGPWDQ